MWLILSTPAGFHKPRLRRLRPRQAPDAAACGSRRLRPRAREPALAAEPSKAAAAPPPGRPRDRIAAGRARWRSTGHQAGHGGSRPSAARKRRAALRPPPPRRGTCGGSRARSGGGYGHRPMPRPLADPGAIPGARTAGKDGAPAFCGPDAPPGRAAFAAQLPGGDAAAVPRPPARPHALRWAGPAWASAARRGTGSDARTRRCAGSPARPRQGGGGRLSGGRHLAPVRAVGGPEAAELCV